MLAWRPRSNANALIDMGAWNAGCELIFVPPVGSTFISYTNLVFIESYFFGSYYEKEKGSLNLKPREVK